MIATLFARLACATMLIAGAPVLMSTAKAQQPQAQQPQAKQPQAKQPSASAIAAARELIILKGAQNMFDPIIPGVIESAKNALLPTNPNLSRELNEVSALLRKEFEPKRAELLDEVATVYAQRFTEQDIKDLIAFYKTPLGKKVLTDEPAAVDQSLKRAQEWANAFSEKMFARFSVEMKKKGHNL